MTLSDDELWRLIEDVEKRFDGPDMLFDVVTSREKHFFRHPEKNPQLSAPFGSHSYQKDLTRKHAELKARLTENAPVVRGFAHPDTQKQRDKVNKVEQLFNTGLDNVQDRQGMNIVDSLADGMIIQAYGVLHWLMADHLFPAVPEAEWEEGKPDPEEPPENFELSLGDQAEASLYRRSPKGILAKHQVDAARAGFPWYIEVPIMQTFLWVEDRSMSNGLAWGILRREIGLMDYLTASATTSVSPEQPLSMNEADSSIPVYGERDAPPRWTPSASDWGDRVTLYCVWGRKDYYEIVCALGGKDHFYVAKKGSHPYEMPPFAIVPAQEINVIEPAYRYLPSLAAAFAIKPHYDRHMAVLLTLAEQNAMPFYYLENTGSGEPALAEDGTLLIMTRDSAQSQKLPDGYKLVAVGPEQLNPAFISLADWWKTELNEAMPPTGRTDSASTAQPWTIRLRQTEANVEPSKLLKNIAHGMQTMIRNMAMVMSKSAEDGGFGVPLATFTKTKNGELDRSKTLMVNPKDFDSVDFSVEINKVSGAEQVSREQHGMEMLGNGVITPDDFYENYMMIPDPTEYQVKLAAQQLAKQYTIPGLGQMAQARWGSVVSLGPNGTFVNGMGQTVDAATVLMMFGQQPVDVAQQGGATGGMNAQLGGNVQSQQPDLPGLSTPGTMPMEGLPG